MGNLTGDNGMVMPVSPMYAGNNGGNNNGWGDGAWLWVLLLFALTGNGWGGFGGGGNGGGGMNLYPWLTQNTQSGFDQAATASALSGIQNSVTQGFAGVEANACNRAMNQLQADYTNQIASMNQSFANSQALNAQLNAMASSQAQCCCENRLGLANLGADIAREACADRAAISDALRDVLVANNAATQKILDQMCQDKIDAKNEKIAELQNQLNMATLRESQTAQNGLIMQGFANETDALYNRLSNCPVPTVPVYGRQPIFSCQNNCGCGCGM